MSAIAQTYSLALIKHAAKKKRNLRPYLIGGSMGFLLGTSLAVVVAKRGLSKSFERLYGLGG